MLDLPRTCENGHDDMSDRVNWDAVEKIKNGCFMTSKYDSAFAEGGPVHFVIFTNFLPKSFKRLSMDRWCVGVIEPEDKTIKFFKFKPYMDEYIPENLIDITQEVKNM